MAAVYSTRLDGNGGGRGKREKGRRRERGKRQRKDPHAAHGSTEKCNADFTTFVGVPLIVNRNIPHICLFFTQSFPTAVDMQCACMVASVRALGGNLCPVEENGGR
jgi:hypothetical protein